MHIKKYTNHLRLLMLMSSLCLLFALSAKGVAAEPTLRIAQTDWANSRYYRIDSDASIEETRKLAVVMDSVFANFQKRFGRAVTIKQRLNIRLISNREDYLRYGKEFCHNFSESWDGYYFYGSEPEFCEMVLYVQKDDEHLKTAIHEGFHQFMHAGIANIFNLPLWLNEGTAEYFETGVINKKNQLMIPGALSPDWRSDLATFQANNELIPLKKLFHVTVKDWNGKNIFKNYATAYAFVHYMVEDNPDALKHFNFLLQGLSQGKEYDDLLKESFNKMDLAELEADFHRWLTLKLEEEPDLEAE